MTTERAWKILKNNYVKPSHTAKIGLWSAQDFISDDALVV